MNAWFADSYYFFALLNPRDPAHAAALSLSRSSRRRLITTAWVLTEVGDGMSQPADRPLFLRLLSMLANAPGNTVIPASESLFDAGVELYARRMDKAWSLTDCISFVVMEQQGLNEALTADHHFEQAGFHVLLK